MFRKLYTLHSLDLFSVVDICSMNLYELCYMFIITQIARFMWQTWSPPGSCRSRWAQCWPHEPWYQGTSLSLVDRMIPPWSVSDPPPPPPPPPPHTHTHTHTHTQEKKNHSIELQRKTIRHKIIAHFYFGCMIRLIYIFMSRCVSFHLPYFHASNGTLFLPSTLVLFYHRHSLD